MSAKLFSSTDSAVIVPAGEYRLGDPCYSVPSDRWMEWLEAAEYKRLDNATHVIAADLDGHVVVGLSTAYGDGEYTGSDGNSYCVDAGLIGLVPTALPDLRADYDGTPLWTTVTFDKPTLCRYDEGTLHFGDLTIETADEPDDESGDDFRW